MKTFVIVTQIRRKDIDAEIYHTICSTQVETIAVQLIWDFSRLFAYHLDTLNLFLNKKIKLYDEDGEEIPTKNYSENPYVTIAIIEKIPEDLLYLKSYYETMHTLYDNLSGLVLNLKPEYNFLGTIAKIEYIRANFQIETVDNF